MYIRSYLKNPKTLLFLDQFIHSGSSFITTLFIIRNFSTQALGQYNLYLIPFLFIQSILDSLYLTPAQSKLPRINLKDLIINRIRNLLIPFLLSSLVGVFIFHFIFFNQNSIIALSNNELGRNSLILALIFIISNCLYMFFRKSLYILLSYKSLVLGSFLRAFLVFSSFVFIYKLKLEFINILYFLSIFNFIVSASFFKSIDIKFEFIKIKYLIYSFKRSFILIKDLFKTAKWLLPSSFLQASSGELIYIISLTVISVDQLGEIKALLAIMAIQNLIFQVLDQYSLINVSKIIKKQGVLKGKNYINRLQKIIFLWSILIFIIILFIAPYLLKLIYGSELENLGNYLRFIFILPILNSIIYPRKVFLIASNQSRYIFKSHIFTFFLNFLIIIPLLNIFGNFGLILLLFIGQLITLVCIYPNIKINKF